MPRKRHRRTHWCAIDQVPAPAARCGRETTGGPLLRVVGLAFASRLHFFFSRLALDGAAGRWCKAPETAFPERVSAVGISGPIDYLMWPSFPPGRVHAASAGTGRPLEKGLCGRDGPARITSSWTSNRRFRPHFTLRVSRVSGLFCRSQLFALAAQELRSILGLWLENWARLGRAPFGLHAPPMTALDREGLLKMARFGDGDRVRWGRCSLNGATLRVRFRNENVDRSLTAREKSRGLSLAPSEEKRRRRQVSALEQIRGAARLQRMMTNTFQFSAVIDHSLHTTYTRTLARDR